MGRQAIRFYYLFYTLFLLVASLLWFSQEHGDFVILINQHRNSFLDGIMPWMTWIGDGIFFGVIILLVLIWKWRLGIYFLVTGITTLVASSFFKRVVFSNIPRPKKYFKEIYTLDFIEGIEVHGSFSFPSGHTMSVFAMITAISFFLTSRKWIAATLVIFAWLVGFSRIYLLQHFLRDVIVGSMMGVLIATAIFLFFRKWLDTNYPFLKG